MTGWVFALGSALLYGLSDFVGGLAARRAYYLTVAVLGQLAGLAVAGIAATAMLSGAPAAADLAWGLLSGIGTAAGMVFLFRGIARGAMTVVVPTSAVTGISLPVLASVVLEGQRPSALAWLGIAIAVPALWLVSGDRTSHTTAYSGGAGDGLLAGVGIAVQYFALAQGSEASGLWPVASGRVGALCVLAPALLIIGPSQRARGGACWLVVASGAAAATALISYFIATHHQIVAVAVVLASLYPVIPVVLGIVVLHERLTWRQTSGLVAAAAATVLLAG